jgi:TonB family protein
MNGYVNYLIEANLGLIVSLLFYELLLRKETQFNFKRAYLLIGILASLLFPLIQIQTVSSAIPSISEVMSTFFLPELIIGDGGDNITSHSFINYWVGVKWTYFVVSMLLLGVLIVKLSGILRYLRKSKSTILEGKFKIIESNINLPTFSFFHYIFIGNTSAFSKEEKDQIIKHEITHATKLHSLDILLVEFLKIIFWFNPVVYYLKTVFTSIHEFQADQLAVDNRDVNQYCNLLARVALQSADYPIANHFNNSLTLKRIAMMKTEKTKLSRWKISAIIPLVAGLFYLVACQEQVRKDEVLTVTEQTASPAEGMTEFYNYIATHLKYPEQARKMGVEGKVFVEFTVAIDGSIEDVTVLKGIGAGCDKAAAELIAASPKWNPAKEKGELVKQKMVLPVTFALN